MPSSQAPDAGSAWPGGPSGRADYSSTPLPVKLGIGEGDEVAVIGAPDQFEDLLGELPDVASFHSSLADDARYDVIVAFMTQRAELEDELPVLRSRMAPACGLWIAFPKRSSKLPTDKAKSPLRTEKICLYYEETYKHP